MLAAYGCFHLLVVSYQDLRHGCVCPLQRKGTRVTLTAACISHHVSPGLHLSSHPSKQWLRLSTPDVTTRIGAWTVGLELGLGGEDVAHAAVALVLRPDAAPLRLSARVGGRLAAGGEGRGLTWTSSRQFSSAASRLLKSAHTWLQCSSQLPILHGLACTDTSLLTSPNQQARISFH